MKRIFLSGVATAGKDEFAKQAIKFFASKNLKAKRFALADQLKNEINPFVYENFGIDILNCTPEEKKIVRPIMVAYGCAKRKITGGRYWIEHLENELEYEESKGKVDIAIITDIRFAEYGENDEAFWASKYGTLIHITRLDEKGDPIPPVNDEERKNDPKVFEFAKYQTIIPTMSKDELYVHVSGILESYPEIWQ